MSGELWMYMAAAAVIGLFAGVLLGMLWAGRGRREAEGRAVEAEQQLAIARARAEETEKAHREKLAEVEKAHEQLKTTFESLAAKALQGNNEQFLQLAESNFGKLHASARGDLEQRKQSIEALVKPLSERLQQMEKELQEIEKKRAGAYSGLDERLKALLDSENELRRQTQSLGQALRNPGQRGRLGELLLERVLQMAGLNAPQHYELQVHAAADEGRAARPDVVVHLPGERCLIIDSKVPVDAFEQAVQAEREEERSAAMQKHARDLASHVQALARRDYPAKFTGSLGFVILFLPGEALFRAALEADGELLSKAAEKRVILATPTTLLALLYAVEKGWQEQRLAEGAAEIQKLGKLFYERAAKLGEDFVKLGKALGNAVSSYNHALGSFESRLLVTARRFEELGVDTGAKELQETAPVDTPLREPQAPELTAGEQDRAGKAD